MPVKQRDNLKRKQIDSLDIKSHLLLLALPMGLFALLFLFAFPAEQDPLLKTALVCSIYLIGYSLSYYIHQGRLNRLWQHLEQVVHINDTTYELVHLSSQYHTEQAFLDALLNKAVCAIQGAEMGSIIRVDKHSHKLTFESVVGLDIDKLNLVDFTLEQSFEYRLTNGRCDKVVVINDMENINIDSPLTKEEQETFTAAAKAPIRSTLSSPIHIDGELYAMMNLDSNDVYAFSDYDRNLVGVLTHEASNAIALYQKSNKIQELANFDGLTGLYNRKKFDSLIPDWQFKHHQASYIVLIDLDNLKLLNDGSGHQAGDYALKSFAELLKATWFEHHLVARYGGDEFVALCHGPKEVLVQQLDNIQKQLQNLTPQISFSYGISEYHLNWNHAFKEADLIMYANKRAKKSHQPMAQQV